MRTALLCANPNLDVEEALLSGAVSFIADVRVAGTPAHRGTTTALGAEMQKDILFDDLKEREDAC